MSTLALELSENREKTHRRLEDHHSQRKTVVSEAESLQAVPCLMCNKEHKLKIFHAEEYMTVSSLRFDVKMTYV